MNVFVIVTHYFNAFKMPVRLSSRVAAYHVNSFKNGRGSQSRSNVIVCGTFFDETPAKLFYIMNNSTAVSTRLNGLL